MGAIGNMKSNITPKARLMIGLTVLAVGGVVTFSYMKLSGASVAESTGVADLNMPPTREQISKDKATDQVRFGDNTAVGELYKNDEKRRAEEAKKGGGSHVDDIRLKLQETKLVVPVKEAIPEEVQPSRLQKLMEERRKAQEKTDSEQRSNAGRQVLTIQENPWKQFLEEELREAAEYEVSAITKVDSIITASKTTPSPKFEEIAQSTNKLNDQKNNSRSTSNSGYAKYLNDPQDNQAGNYRDNGRYDDSDESADENEVSQDYPSERIAKAAVTKKDVNGTVHVGDSYYSVLQIGINTDEISPVRAVSVDRGLLEGAVFVGNPARTGEKAVVTFTSMKYKGRSYKINAIAVDPDTQRSGIVDGVDNHVFSRYSKLALAAFVDGYANALTSTQTINNSDGSSSTITNPLPNAADQIKVGIGKVGEKMTPIFEKEFERPPTVTVEPNRSIVVMFMQEIDLAALDKAYDQVAEQASKN